MDSFKLELLKNKEEHAQSAIASREVKEHLANFISQRQVYSSSNIHSASSSSASLSATTTTTTNNQHFQPAHNSSHIHNLATNFSPKTSNDVNKRSKASTLVHYPDGYRLFANNQDLMEAGQEDDHPLRKTASMPTMHVPYKAQSHSRRRQLERRTTMSPLTKRRLRHRKQSNNLNSQDSDAGAECGSSPCMIQSSSSSLPQPANLSIGEIQTELPAATNTSFDKNSISRRQLNEALRNTIIRRATGKMVLGGSLDIEGSLPSTQKNPEPSRIGNLTSGRAGLANYNSELRQWSLDGADRSLNLSKQFGPIMNPLGNPLAIPNPCLSNIFHKDLQKHRFTTTSDAAVLRRSQSPNSSINMGLSGNKANSMLLGNLPQPTGNVRDSKLGRITAAHLRHHSSSSSSNSSLLSQQDSLEDSRAIDLSSSSELSRSRNQQQPQQQQQQQQQQHQQPHLNQVASQLLKRTNAITEPTYQAYQKALQESFNQLQLSQHLISGSDNSNNNKNNIQQSSPSLSSLSKAATSLDAPSSCDGNYMASLSRQFNLSASAQNLLSIQERNHHDLSYLLNQRTTVGLFSEQAPTTNLNQNTLLPSIYNQLLENPKQSSVSDLLSKIATLPEAYKSTLITSLLHNQLQQQQQQQQHHHQQQLNSRSHIQQTGHPNLTAQMLEELTKSSSISRASSSPLLRLNSVVDNPLETPMIPLSSLQQAKSNSLISAHDSGDKPEAMVLDSNNSHRERQTELNIDMIIDTIDESLGNNNSSIGHQRSMLNKQQFLEEESCSKAKEESMINPRLNFNYDPQSNNCIVIKNVTFNESSATGLTYDPQMCSHKCYCGIEKNHPENGRRIMSIWRRLSDKGLMAKCARIESRKATLEELLLCHSETYCLYFGKTPCERIRLNKLDLSKLPIEGLTQLECGGQGADVDTAWNEEQTPAVARLAAGCVIEAACRVAEGKLLNAFAVVRPPGHHAENQQAIGFCFFNNVAIAAKVLIKRHKLNKILIVDWDVHHGNGIQKMFYDDPQVMYISLHRHDNGNFFPGTGKVGEIGQAEGEGYNWNIPWSGDTMGDAEYMAAFRSILMPIARDLNPSIVLVACGFDAASGHPFNFGGYQLSPACFGFMTSQLMRIANGRLVLCLEGGFKIEVISDCAECCMRALLEQPCNEDNLCQVKESELMREPNQSAVEILQQVSSLAMRYWPSVMKWRTTIGMSALKANNLIK